MPRRTKEQIAADRAARAARLGVPVVPVDSKHALPPTEGQRRIQPEGAQGVTPEQRLKDIQAQRVELMDKLAKYRHAHQLEFFKPHPKQAEFVRAILDPDKSTFSFVAGNRTGKTAIAMALAVAFAHGRLPWVPVPKPFTVPNPLSSSLKDGQVIARFTKASADAIRKAWDATFLPPDIAPIPPTPLPGVWTLFPDGETVEAVFPLSSNNRAKEGLDLIRSRLQNPQDPARLRFKTPVKVRIFGEKNDTLEQVQVPYLKKFIAPEWLALSKKGQSGVTDHYLFNNGSSIDLLTYQMEPASMEGWDGHLVLFDEPPPRPTYIANVRGLVDHKGISVFSMTPLKEPWIADEVVNNPDPSYFSITASSHENPHVEKSALDAFFSKLNEEELETRRDGKFLHLQGLVFKEFKKEVHVVKPFTPDRAYTVYAAIDNHPRTEQAVLFVAVDRHDRVFAFKEIFQHGTPEEIVAWITEFHDHTHPIEMVLIDRSSQGDTNRGLSTYEVIEEGLNRAGIPLDFGSKDLQGGIQIVRDYLLSRNGVPSLFIAEDCTRLIWELLRYRWAEWRAGADKSTRTPLNKPVDADDHLVENLRRLLQLPPAWVDPRHRALLQGGERRWEPSDPLAGY